MSGRSRLMGIEPMWRWKSGCSGVAPAFLAFRDGRLFAIVQLDVSDDTIAELHAIVDPAKLALVGPFVSEVTG